MRGYAAIGLYQPKNDFNIGGALRAVWCYRGTLVAIQGKKTLTHATDTFKAVRHIPIITTNDLLSVIPYDCVPIAIEIDDNAVDLATFTHPNRAFYIFGPENGSIPKSVMQKCKYIVRVNTRGCMNLAASVNVVLFDRQSKLIRAQL